MPIANTSANPYRIKQSGLVAIGPEDHFRIKEVAEDADAAISGDDAGVSPPDPDGGASGGGGDASAASNADTGGAMGERLRLARRRLDTVLSPGGGTGPSPPRPAAHSRPLRSASRPSGPGGSC